MFKFRPADPNDEDWEDNWLSNALAYLSKQVLPKYCATPKHYSSRISNYLWTDCPCCLFWRGALFGVSVTIILAGCFASVYSLLS